MWLRLWGARERIIRGKATRETVYAITRPTADEAGHAPQVPAALRTPALTRPLSSAFKPAEGFEHLAEPRQAANNAVTAMRTE